MNYLDEIVRELCWNPDMDDLFNYLIVDRLLEIDKDDVYKVKSVIGDYVDSLYSCEPWDNNSINMNLFVDDVENKVWRKYKIELETL